MKKKLYKNPEMEVVELKSMNLLAGSPGDKSEGEATQWGAPEMGDFDFEE